MDMWERWWEMYEQENECYASFAKDAESEAPLWLEMVPGGLGAVIAGDRRCLIFAVMRVIATVMDFSPNINAVLLIFSHLVHTI